MKQSTIIRSAIALVCSVLIPLSATATSFAATSSDIYGAADKATAYLTSLQQSDGSISGYDGSSDWAAIALAATGVTNTKLDTYIANETAPTTVTGIERKILALSATGQATSGYDALLAKSYQSNQLGDPTLLNDDWFGVMAIIAAKDTADYPIVSDSVNYIIAHQDTTGGFGYCADPTSCGVDSNDTAAAVIALASAQKVGITNPQLGTAIASAVGYLQKTKQTDGGFGYDTNSWTTSSDSASTSWTLMALNTVGDDSLQKTIDGAQNWLIFAQDAASGSYGYQWNGYNADTPTTANAILALVGTNWLLNPKPLDRPTSATPTPTPTPEPAPVTVPPAAPVAASVTTTAANSASDTSTVTTDPTPTNASNGAVQGASTTTPVDTTHPVAASNSALPSKTPKEQTHTTTVAHTVGISLIAAAVLGLFVYAVGLHNRRKHQLSE